MTAVAEPAAPALPPHSMQAEQAVLGALLMDNAVLADVAPLLRPADFYAGDHGGIYAAVLALAADAKPADVVTVFERTQGDFGYLNQLAVGVASARNARAHAELVRELAQRRRLLRMARELAEDAMRQAEGARPLAELLDGAMAGLLSLQAAAAGTDPVAMTDALAAFLDDLQARAEGRLAAISTGLGALDRLTAGGGRKGELWVFGGRPGMGKSALVLQLCRHVAREHAVLLLTQEDSLLSATGRMVAAAGGVNLADIRNPARAPDAMWGGVSDGAEDLRGLRLHMDDYTGLTISDVRRKAMQVHRQAGGLDLIVVDYLQLMDDGGGANRNQALGALAYGLQRVAKELGVWVVLLSQLSRKADERSGPPQMGDLRDSGDIEGAAHLIALLHREHVRKPREETRHWAQLNVVKQKNGPADLLNLYFDGARQRFGDWDGPPPGRGAGGAD